MKPGILSDEQIAAIKTKQEKNKANVAAYRAKKKAEKLAKDAAMGIIPAPIPPPKDPKDYLFKPGVSGNPGGRPKSRPVKDAIEKVLTAKACGDDKNQIEKMVRMVRDKMIKFLSDDDLDIDDLHILVQDIEILATRAEGKPVQEIENNGGNAGNQLVINIGTRFKPEVPQAEIIECN